MFLQRYVSGDDLFSAGGFGLVSVIRMECVDQSLRLGSSLLILNARSVHSRTLHLYGGLLVFLVIENTFSMPDMDSKTNSGLGLGWYHLPS